MKVSKKQIAKWQDQEAKKSAGRVANNLETEGYVRDRKTGEYYKPQEAFDRMMNKPEIQAVFRRLAVR
jgi:hypothetical protein